MQGKTFQPGVISEHCPPIALSITGGMSLSLQGVRVARHGFHYGPPFILLRSTSPCKFWEEFLQDPVVPLFLGERDKKVSKINYNPGCKQLGPQPILIIDYLYSAVFAA